MATEIATAHSKKANRTKSIAVMNGKNSGLEKSSGRESSYMLLPWLCRHYPDLSEIRAYAPITGDWETIAQIRVSKGVDAEPIANFIAQTVNDYQESHELIYQMTAVLEECLACNGRVTAKIEQQIKAILRRMGTLELKEILNVAARRTAYPDT